ncbi:hypothetical protein TNCV_2073751, partial [Trichonephila clavipes]
GTLYGKARKKSPGSSQSRGGKVAVPAAALGIRIGNCNRVRDRKYSVECQADELCKVEDRKKTSSNYRISIGRAEEHVRETLLAALMAGSLINTSTPIKEIKRNGRDLNH